MSCLVILIAEKLHNKVASRNYSPATDVLRNLYLDCIRFRCQVLENKTDATWMDASADDKHSSRRQFQKFLWLSVCRAPEQIGKLLGQTSTNRILIVFGTRSSSRASSRWRAKKKRLARWRLCWLRTTMQGWGFESMKNRRFLRQLNLMIGHKTPASCEAESSVQSLAEAGRWTEKSESSKLAFCSPPQNPSLRQLSREEEKKSWSIVRLWSSQWKH